ncbi:hypothetical protein H8S37_04255 [Mediterraneibacter sp. NSJ-55]|uniref:Uncharacterized protein n=1 Tax=Mediterraneibacter hominis TaxID=2763054 RepID=A0A923LHG9_9FIRM|nr:hypothetical protein [Mediterraneibacter hominis]MBC5688146.1 hypothetical protein [Mediterraneibacter hominis]
MNTNQKALTYLDIHAREVKNIANSKFFLDTIHPSSSEPKNGTYERIVCESVMATFHLDNWTSTARNMYKYLNNKQYEDEFKKISEYMNRIETVCANKYQDIFISKNIYAWIATFDYFTTFNLDDARFLEFLDAFKEELINKPVDGLKFEDTELNAENEKRRGTKDKIVVTTKISILKTLMKEFFHKDDEPEEELISDYDFVREVLDYDLRDDQIEFCEELLDDLTINVDNNSKLMDEKNRKSLLAIVTYATENDMDLDDWIVDYFKRNHIYMNDQRQNFRIMKQDVENYMRQKEKIAV